MFLIRQVSPEDASTLLKLAKMVHFINLPADPEIIRTKIARSRKSFAGEADDRERMFMFVLVDPQTDAVIGTSSIICCLSWPGWPHTYMQVRRREHCSRDLQGGQVHVTLQLGTDESGPTEIGGLVLGPSYRGHDEKLGALLSLVRFHFVGRQRESFADRILAEMMGPLNESSVSEFWEGFGRRFINLSFQEADLFCQRSKEFITSLFPKEEIYVSLLSAGARNAIGRVGIETEPALRLLERVGFHENGHIDPFDAGPYLEAKTDDIGLVKQTKTATLSAGNARGDFGQYGLVSVHRGADFRAVRTAFAASGGTLSIPGDALEALGADAGEEVAYTPLEDWARPRAARGRARSTKAPAS